MRALSIRQPYVEEILLGLKRIEYRSQRVSDELLHERFYLYAALKFPTPAEIRQYCRRHWDMKDLKVGLLPTGVLVGTARIAACTTRDGLTFEWHLTDVRRLRRLRKPRRQPQPVWWWPN